MNKKINLCLAIFQFIFIGIAPLLALKNENNATIVVLDDNIEIVGCIKIDTNSNMERVLIEAPKNGDAVYAKIVGDNVHEKVNKDLFVSSKRAEGYTGKVVVFIEDDTVVSIRGNSFDYNLIEEDKIHECLSNNNCNNDSFHIDGIDITIIPVDRYRKNLVENDEGNWVPPNMTSKENHFIKKINNHINKGNKDLIMDMIHMQVSNNNGYPINRWFKEVLEREFEYYKFTRLDKTHPDNQKYLNDNYNLDISWIIEFYKKIGDINYTNVYEVGEYNGKLAFALPEN